MPVSALAAAVSAASLNLCADEYLLLLARPDEIASVSFLSQDPLESPLWREARAHPSNRGSLEQVITQRPNVILTMGGGGRATILIARRLGIRSVDLNPGGSIADVEANLERVAAALGDPGRAKPWLARLYQLRASAPPHRSEAAWLGHGGRSLAPGSSGAEWLALAGFVPQPGFGDRAMLERLIVDPPKILIKSRYRSGQRSRGQQWLDHPAVRRLASRTIVTDGRRWTCFGPTLIAEIERLREANR